MGQVKLPQGTVSYRESGSGPPIVFVHGLLASGTLWSDIVPLLEDRFRCIVPDLPLGSHATAMEPSADLSTPGVAALLDAFMAALDLRDVTLVGNDTGGAICQVVAVNHPERLARMVLTSCDLYDDFPPAMFKPLLWIARLPGGVATFVQPTRIAALHNTPLAYGLLAKRPIDRDRTRAWLHPALTDAGVRRDLAKVLRGIDKRHTLDAAERLGSFDKPVLFAWAGDERLFKLELAERLAATMPDARVVQIPDSYTFVSIDQPARTAEVIGEFAGDRAGARGTKQGVA